MKMLMAFLVALVLGASVQAEIGGLSFSMEYLYWKVQEGQLYPAIFTEQSANGGLSNITLKNQDFDYTSGFRAALGYEFCCEPYDCRLAWTWLRPSTNTSFSTSSDARTLIAISFFDQTNSDVPHAESVQSHWFMNYNMLDLELGRFIQISSCFGLRPHIGLKGGWIHQNQNMDVGGIGLGQPAVEMVQGNVRRQNNFSGIGPRVGFDMHCGIGSGFGIFGACSGALVYGKFDLQNKIFLADSLDNSGAPGNGPTLNILNNSEYALCPTVQMLLGGEWSECFCQKYWVRLGVAYEVQFWWNQMRANTSIPQLIFTSEIAGGDLMMHGLTVQANLTY